MIELSFAPDGALQIDASTVGLGRLEPVVNGQPLADAQIIDHDVLTDGTLYTRYSSPTLGSGTFHVEERSAPDAYSAIRYWLEGLPDDVQLDSFGLRFSGLTNLRAFLRNGYFSWDGSSFIDVEPLRRVLPAAPPVTGYAMTQLLPFSGSGSLVLGFDRHDRFQQTFTVDVRMTPATLTVQTLWDRKDRRGLDHCASERLLISEHVAVEDGLRDWARVVADKSPLPPRLSTPRIMGWCSWYNLYAAITEDNLLEHLRGVAEVKAREALPLWVFQIDDGFTPEMGDWLDVKPQFPRGMKPLLDDIRAEGFTPGLWIAPFMVGNRSQLYREHPDWVVTDRLTGGPLAHMRFYAEFRWHKRSEEYYILDATHPDALAYLRRVFHVWHHDWGCDYFKTDFMHFGSEYGPDRAVWHQPGLTRIEVWRRVAEMIREEIGAAVWLGCGCALWASVGLVDAVRIGRDVGVSWRGNHSAQSLLRDLALRNFGNRILWQTDPDCILLRDQFHELTGDEVRSLALYAGMASGAVVTSDALDALSDGRLALWKLLLNPQPATCHFPLLGQTPGWVQASNSPNPSALPEVLPLDPVLAQVRLPDDPAANVEVLLFNTGDQAVERRYPLTALNLPPRMQPDPDDPALVEALTVTLAPHESRHFTLRRS